LYKERRKKKEERRKKKEEGSRRREQKKQEAMIRKVAVTHPTHRERQMHHEDCLPST